MAFARCRYVRTLCTAKIPTGAVIRKDAGKRRNHLSALNSEMLEKRELLAADFTLQVLHAPTWRGGLDAVTMRRISQRLYKALGRRGCE